jgi:hypothetical protein
MNKYKANKRGEARRTSGDENRSNHSDLPPPTSSSNTLSQDAQPTENRRMPSVQTPSPPNNS